MCYSRVASVIYDISQFSRETQAFGVASLQLHFFTHLSRTRRIAAKLRSLCVTSTKAVAMAASFTTWCIASWSPTARSARWSWSHRTGAMPRAAGRPCSGPSARPAPTGPAPPRATGQVRLATTPLLLLLCSLLPLEFIPCLFRLVWSMVTVAAALV